MFNARLLRISSFFGTAALTTALTVGISKIVPADNDAPVIPVAVGLTLGVMLGSGYHRRLLTHAHDIPEPEGPPILKL
jgi:hypothetical protein